MRFKPPPANSEIGWRVEFRPCELQFTDFENAAIVCFVVFLTRAILSYGYNLLVSDELIRNIAQHQSCIRVGFFLNQILVRISNTMKRALLKD